MMDEQFSLYAADEIRCGRDPSPTRQLSAESCQAAELCAMSRSVTPGMMLLANQTS